MLFKEAENQSAYLKCGIMGFAGSGKTFTSAKIAIGLHKYIKSDKPIYFLDTETGSDFLLPHFNEAKIKLNTCKSRAFVDLLAAVGEAEGNKSILIIDSITHFWVEVMTAFKKSRNLERLTLQHWIPIKEEWRTFTDKFINSKCHIILAGRAGWEFQHEKDEEGVNELVKTGTKMKAEGEMGYEPSILIEMERIRERKGQVGSSVKRRAWIIKDRYDLIDGQYFDNPDFESFLPHIKMLNLNGEHMGADTTRTSEYMFDTDKSAYHNRKKKDILLEELDNFVGVHFNNRTQDGKKDLCDSLMKCFKATSKTAIASFALVDLENGFNELKKLVKEREKNATKKEKK